MSPINRVLSLLAAVSLVVIGLTGVTEGGFYLRAFALYFDFGPHSEFIGIGLIVVGGVSAWIGLRPSHPNQNARR